MSENHKYVTKENIFSKDGTLELFSDLNDTSKSGALYLLHCDKKEIKKTM